MGRGPSDRYFQVLNECYVDGTLTCLKPSVIEQRINTKFPLVLNIEPTNDCNAKCYYCAREMMIKEQGIHYLSIMDFRNIIDQIGNNKLIMLNLHKNGEPLLNKNLPEMVTYAKEKNAADIIHLNTNGILLNSSVGKGIIKHGIDDITVSIDAAFEDTYVKFKGLSGLEKLESNIIKAIEYRNKIRSLTKIRVKIMEFDEVSKEELNLFHKKWTDVADEVQVTGIHNWSGAVGVKVTDEQVGKRYVCALLWYMLAINSNGKVGLCSVDWNYSGVVGDIHTQTIHEIWNGILLKKIRQAQLKGIWDYPKVCEKCVVWVSVGNMTEFFKRRRAFISK